MSKTFIGVSYLLQGFPFINFIGALLVPIGWILEGRSKKKGFWIATGIVGLIGIALAIAGLAMVFSSLIAFITSEIQRGKLLWNISYETRPVRPLIRNEIVHEMMRLLISNPALLSGMLLVLIGILVGFIYVVMSLVSIFQAGKLYSSGLIEVGGILFIVAIILTAVFIGALITYHRGLTLGGPNGMLIIGTGIIDLLASILTGIGFLVAQKPATKKEY